MRRILIAGGGLCAVSAASTLRSLGFDGELGIVGLEPELPYERPPLSKGYLLGETPVERLRIRPARWYADNDVQLHLASPVRRLDPRSRTVHLSDGTPLGYDAVLIATGGRPRRLSSITSERVLYLRDRRDADGLAAGLRAGEQLLIVGAGFIGCEVAAAARRCGVAVTVIEREDQPLGSVLGASVGQVLADVHRDAGVRLRTGERVLSITERSDGLQVTTDRARLECAKLLVAIGIEPNTALLAGSGVDCADGVRVDEFCATNVARVFAAGDVASHYHPTFGAHVRVEHYDNAIKQGAAAAASMLGTPTPYVNPHWFWSDQYEHNLQSVGIAAGHDQVVIRGDLDGLSFSVFYLRYGVVRSVFAFNRAADVSLGRRMVLGAMRPDPDLLRDPDQDLRLAMLPTA